MKNQGICREIIEELMILEDLDDIIIDKMEGQVGPPK